MIITTEKYRDSYIVYIDEGIENIDDLPIVEVFERLGLACENLGVSLQMLVNTIDPEIIG